MWFQVFQVLNFSFVLSVSIYSERTLNGWPLLPWKFWLLQIWWASICPCFTSSMPVLHPYLISVLISSRGSHLSVCLSVCLYVCVGVTMVRVKSHPSRHWLAELRLKKRSKWWRVSSFHSTTRSSTTLLNRRPWVSNSKPTRPPSSSASTLHPPTSFHLFLTCSSCQFSAETVYLGQCLVIFVCHYLWGLHY